MKVMSMFLGIVLFASLVTVSSQTRDQAHEQYVMWRRSVLSSLDNDDHLYYYRIATVIKRIDDNHVQVKIAVVGRVPSYNFSFQPIGVLRSFEPEAEQELAGKEHAWSVAKAVKQPSNGKLVDLEQVLEVEAGATAIKISVKPNADSGQPQETATLKAIVELTDQWSFSEMTTFVPPPPQSRWPPPNNSAEVDKSRVFLVTLSRIVSSEVKQ